MRAIAAAAAVSLVLIVVCGIEVAHLGIPENQQSQRALPGRVKRDAFTRRIEHDHLASWIDASRQWQGRDVESGVAHEARLRTKCQAPHIGMEPVRAHDDIEAPWRTALERYIHARAVVVQRRNGIPEHEFGRVTACVAQNRR